MVILLAPSNPWNGCYTVDGRNPANQLIGTLSHYLQMVVAQLIVNKVISIDELMFEAFTPLRAKETVEKTRLVHVEDRQSRGSTFIFSS